MVTIIRIVVVVAAVQYFFQASLLFAVFSQMVSIG